MCDINSNVLVEIPDADLPKLALLYQEKAPWAPYMVNFVHTGIKWKKSGKYRNVLTFMSPNNTWEEDGTLISVLTYFRRDVFLFTLSDDCTNLYRGLLQTDLFDTCERILIYGVHERHVSAVEKYVVTKNLKIFDNSEYLMYAIEPEEAKKFYLECPHGTYVKKLHPSAATQADSIWPFKFPGSENYLRSFIEMDGGWGVFLKPDDQMVAWVLWHVFGHLTMLQTEDEHKKKGYGTLVTKALAKQMAEEGFWPVGAVMANNTTSVKTFEKCGFSRIGVCNFIIIVKEK